MKKLLLMLATVAMAAGALAQTTTTTTGSTGTACTPYTIVNSDSVVPCGTGYVGVKYTTTTKTCPDGTVTVGKTYDTSQCVAQSQTTASALKCTDNPASCQSPPLPVGCPGGTATQDWALNSNGVAYCKDKTTTTTQYRTVSCPSGYVGEKDQSRTVTTDLYTGVVTNSSWTTYSNTCTAGTCSNGATDYPTCTPPVTCTNTSSTTTSACPSGQTGSITSTYSTNSCTGVKTLVSTSNTCATTTTCTPSYTTSTSSTACTSPQTGTITTTYTTNSCTGQTSSSTTNNCTTPFVPPAAPTATVSVTNKCQFVGIELGNDGVCSSSPIQFSVVNTGTGTLTIGSVTLGPSPGIAWSVSGCSGASLAPGQSCDVTSTGFFFCGMYGYCSVNNTISIPTNAGTKSVGVTLRSDFSGGGA
jgi:hypothetical protein